ncbi:cation diffusion facilitator family transporter [Zavarzinia sp.]|uniref:cation diffusion facilitator family transporter n=1 Tax=Zavarzinia sp. TaxID=2027920 RepID=UPI003567608E
MASSHHDHDHDHDHEHDHAHDRGHHGHHHHGDPNDHGRAFIVAIVLNTAFVGIEFTYGLLASSTALMADAGHNLSDVLGLLVAWGAALLAKRTPSERFTYGLRSSSILAALANAVFLLIACGGIAVEAVQRFLAPPPVEGLTVTLVAGAGIVVNGISAWLFVAGSKGDLNIRGAYLHMAADAAVSLGVVIAGLAIMATGWFWLDPVISLVIVAVIVAGTWGLLKESVGLALSAVPRNVELAAVRDYLRECPGVSGIHDLHIWAMSTTDSALTAHLVMPDGYPGDAFVDEVALTLKTRFSIAHVTLQVEQGTTEHVCTLHGKGVAA